MTELHMVVPGSLDQRTGGYLYDARMARGLEALGWRVPVHELEGSFPGPDPEAAGALDAALRSVPDGRPVLLDGLAAGAFPELLAAHGGRLRLLVLLHHPLADETGLSPARAEELRSLERAALEQVEGVLVSSTFTAARLVEAYGVPADRVRAVVPGTERPKGWDGGEGQARARSETGAAGAPDEPPVPDAAAVDAQTSEPGPVLLCVGSVIPRKGQDVLLHALARLQELPWRCTVAGSLKRDVDYAGRVRAQASAYGLSRRVRFTGELGSGELEECYRRADLFVLPSHYEGYGMALTEALVRGLPVVSTTGGAIPHTVPARVGLLVPPGDAAALAGALRTLLSDSGVRRAYAQAARRHARELPSWEAQVETMARAIEELLAQSTREATA